MYQLPHEVIDNYEPDCFFNKLLRECSMQVQESYQYPWQVSSNSHEITNEYTIGNQYLKHQLITHNQLYYEDPDLTDIPETHLFRAKSSRMEQQRKINNFIEVFGTLDVNHKDCPLKTYCPTKKRKLIKKSKK